MEERVRERKEIEGNSKVTSVLILPNPGTDHTQLRFKWLNKGY